MRSSPSFAVLLLAAASVPLAGTGCGRDAAADAGPAPPTAAVDGTSPPSSADASADATQPGADVDGAVPDAAGGGDDASASDGSADVCTLDPLPGNDNQTQINEALASGCVVQLNPGTYVIDGTIEMTSGSTLEGSKGARITLVSAANWPANQPMIEGQSVSNVHLTGLEVDGNGPNNTTSNGASTVCGKYYYTMLYFTGSKGVEVDHMYLHDNWNGIFKFSASSAVAFHDNTVRREGHDVVYAIHSTNVRVYDNDIKIACNSGVRPDGTTSIYVYDNVITRDGGGYAGIEIQGASDVWACNNDIHGLVGPTIANLSNAPLHTTGCPTAPPPSYPPEP